VNKTEVIAALKNIICYNWYIPQWPMLSWQLYLKQQFSCAEITLYVFKNMNISEVIAGDFFHHSLVLLV
jgi:hypothetical protein